MDYRGATPDAPTKPYFSPRHNMAIRLTLYPMYALALLGVTVAPRVAGLRLALVCWLVLQCALVASTFEDWSGRWLMHALPAIFVFAGAGGMCGQRWLASLASAVRSGVRDA